MDSIHTLPKEIDTLLRRVRSAQFSPELFRAVKDLRERITRLREGSLEYYRALCVIGEVLDYEGNFPEARELLRTPGERVVNDLTVTRRLSEDSSSLLIRQKIWLATHYAHTLYRDDTAQALKRSRDVLQLCLNTLSRMEEDGQHFYGTRARIMYSLGQVCRRLQLFAEAERAFCESIELFSLRLPEKVARILERAEKQNVADSAETADRVLQEEMFTDYSVAKSLALGLGRLYHSQSRLQQALPLLTTAALLLRHTGDHFHLAYIDMLRGSIQRNLAGPARVHGEARKFKPIIEILEKAKTRSQDHSVFSARLAYELALTRWAMGDPLGAQKAAEEVGRIAVAAHNERWAINSEIVKSMIELKYGDPAKAAKLAADAYEHAQRHSISACENDALLAQVEALIELGKCRDAHEMITKVQRSDQNTKVLARCYILKARLYLLEGDLRRAEEQLKSWQSVERTIEDGFLRAEAQRVACMIEDQKPDFVIASTEGNLDYEHHKERLREYLLKRASETAAKDKDILSILGITRPTLLEWRRGGKRGSKRRGGVSGLSS